MSGLPPSLQGLLSPRAYPHVVQSVELIETHISWVLLTGEWAYKIKRPVHYPFVDLRSAEHRTFLCHEELRLNRRFAPDLYVAVCPVTLADGGVRLGGAGKVIEHAVKMRQFPRAEVLDRLLETQHIATEELAQFGRSLARIHATLPVVPAGQVWSRPDIVRAQILENLAQCAAAAELFGAMAAVNALRPALETAIDSVKSWMSLRWDTGRVRECHGDLHCGNIVRCASHLLAFDCLEFDPALRWVDVAQETATLLADLHARHRPELANAFLGGYLEQAGDYQACRMLSVYQAHRALVRAKVAALNAAAATEGQPDSSRARQEFARHVQCAGEFLSARQPILILMHGLSGSGKTWLAQRLAPRLGAVYLSSDLERKRIAESDEKFTSGHRSQDSYSAQSRARVYGHLAQCVGDTLAGGYTTIVDATFGRREDRERFQALAARAVIPVWLVNCHAPPEVLRARIQARLLQKRDLSEADLKVLEWQERHLEPVAPTELLKVLDVNTADPVSLGELDRAFGKLGGN